MFPATSSPKACRVYFPSERLLSSTRASRELPFNSCLAVPLPPVALPLFCDADHQRETTAEKGPPVSLDEADNTKNTVLLLTGIGSTTSRRQVPSERPFTDKTLQFDGAVVSTVQFTCATCGDTLPARSLAFIKREWWPSARPVSVTSLLLPSFAPGIHW